MGVRSKRLAAASGGVADYTLVTAASGETVLIKRLTVVNSGASGSSYFWWIQPGGAGTKFYVHVESAVVTATGRDLEVWYVLQPGDVFGCLTVTSTLSYLTVHGAELEGVAD